jgi:hypothetical protein
MRGRRTHARQPSRWQCDSQSASPRRKASGEMAGGKEVPSMKKITIRKTGAIKLTAPAMYIPFFTC